MIRKILSLLGFNTALSFTNQSNDVFNIFTKTVKKLSKINIEINKSEHDKLIERVKLDKEIALLEAQKLKNKEMIDKVNSFLG